MKNTILMAVLLGVVILSSCNRSFLKKENGEYTFTMNLTDGAKEEKKVKFKVPEKVKMYFDKKKLDYHLLEKMAERTKSQAYIMTKYGPTFRFSTDPFFFYDDKKDQICLHFPFIASNAYGTPDNCSVFGYFTVSDLGILSADFL